MRSLLAAGDSCGGDEAVAALDGGEVQGAVKKKYNSLSYESCIFNYSSSISGAIVSFSDFFKFSSIFFLYPR